MNKDITMIHHTRQSTYEYYYEGTDTLVPTDVVDNTPMSSVHYIALVHSQGRNKLGLYGRYINW